jgi:hypothetical protein
MDTPIQKFSVGGIKLSVELVQLLFFPTLAVPLNEIFRRLADRQINLTGVSLEAIDGQLTGLCCLEAGDRVKAEQALQPFEGSFALRSPVGTLTIFPHQSRLELIGKILSVLGRLGLPVYGLASSHASLTITTDFRRLDEAVSAVCRLVTLPENHAPFRPEFRVKQL